MRQYIGARYVPIFGGEWNADKEYENLTIVSYNGDSYTSRRNVPAGIVPTNDVYWALTGAYNTQFSALKTQVNEYSGEVADIKNDFESIENQFTNVTENVDRLQSTVDKIVNTNMLLITGSTDVDGDTFQKYSTRVKNALPNYNIEVVNASGYMSLNSNTFVNWLKQNIQPNYLNMPVIYIMIDDQNTDSIQSDYNNLFTYLNSTFLKSMIYIGFTFIKQNNFIYKPIGYSNLAFIQCSDIIFKPVDTYDTNITAIGNEYMVSLLIQHIINKNPIISYKRVITFDNANMTLYTTNYTSQISFSGSLVNHEYRKTMENFLFYLVAPIAINNTYLRTPNNYPCIFQLDGMPFNYSLIYYRGGGDLQINYAESSQTNYANKVARFLVFNTTFNTAKL